MIAGVIAFMVSIAILVHAINTRVQAKRLRARLRPIEARMIDPGRQAQQELAGAHTTSTADDHLPSVSTHYTGRWRYMVNGRQYEGATSLDVPVFAEDEIKFGRVQVYYDPENPALSTARPGHGDHSRAWFIAAGVVAMAGLLFLTIEAAQNAPPHRGGR